jgi:hypothetical protein
MYAGQYIGQPLFCSTLDAPLFYDHDSPPWVALPFGEFGDTWQCGDLVYVRVQGYPSIMARALDTGPFGDYCVIWGTGECLLIVVDIPLYYATFPGLSARVEVSNISAVARECRARGWCD